MSAQDARRIRRLLASPVEVRAKSPWAVAVWRRMRLYRACTWSASVMARRRLRQPGGQGLGLHRVLTQQDAQAAQGLRLAR